MLIVGIDVHKHDPAAALIDDRGAQIAALWLPNSPAGSRRLIDWLSDHQAADAVIGVESPGSYGRCLVAALTAAGFEVLQVPAWRTHRERRRGPGKADPGDALSIAHVVLTAATSSVPPRSPRSFGRWRCSSCSVDGSSETAPKRSSGCGPTGPSTTPSARQPPSAAIASPSCANSSGSTSATASVGRSPRAASESWPETSRISAGESPLSMLRSHSSSRQLPQPLQDLHGAGSNLTATIIAQADDVRRFRDINAVARFCGAAPIPCGSGQTSGHRRVHRGGNRQLNAALYRSAIVQQRHHPDAKRYLVRKIAKGKTPREARRALKHHLANVLYRQLSHWAEKTLPTNIP